MSRQSEYSNGHRSYVPGQDQPQVDTHSIDFVMGWLDARNGDWDPPFESFKQKPTPKEELLQVAIMLVPMLIAWGLLWWMVS